MNPITQDTVMTGLQLLFIPSACTWILLCASCINSFSVRTKETPFLKARVLKNHNFLLLKLQFKENDYFSNNFPILFFIFTFMYSQVYYREVNQLIKDLKSENANISFEFLNGQ